MNVFERWEVEAMKSDHRKALEYALRRRRSDRADRVVGLVCVAIGLWLLFGAGS